MSPDARHIIGFDIGGAHIKAVNIHWQKRLMDDMQIAIRTFEMWHEYKRLSAVLREIGTEIGLAGVQALAVTMTAELADAFSCKREGVLFVIEAIVHAFPDIPVYLLNIDGKLVREDGYSPPANPLDYAATNWLASAQYLATTRSDFIFMDVGSTTTDIIPVRNNCVATRGCTDPQRLTTGELVYTGILRSNPDTIANQVPIQGQMCRVAAEYFANMGDVYLILNLIQANAYSCPTPDGRDKTREAAQRRLARLVCADTEILNNDQIFKLARYLFEKQIQTVTEALLQVLSAQPTGSISPLIAAGSGAFLATETGRRLGFSVIDLQKDKGTRVAAAFPSLAVACLTAIGLENPAND